MAPIPDDPPLRDASFNPVDDAQIPFDLPDGPPSRRPRPLEGLNPIAVLTVIAFAVAAIVLVWRSVSTAFLDLSTASVVLSTSATTSSSPPTPPEPSLASPVATGTSGPAAQPPSDPGAPLAFLLDRAFMSASPDLDALGGVPTLVQLRPRRELLLDTGTVLVEGQRLDTGAEVRRIETDQVLLELDGRRIVVPLR